MRAVVYKGSCVMITILTKKELHFQVKIMVTCKLIMVMPP